MQELSASGSGGPASEPVLVLGWDERSTLAVVRSLGRAGHPVHLAWNRPGGAPSRSRHVRARHELPLPEEGAARWLAPFLELCARERFALVLPLDDPSLIAFAGERTALGALPVHLPNEATLRLAFDKLATWELARSLAIPVPRQVRVERGCAAAELAPRLAAELGWPLVLKPRHSFAFGRQKWEHGVRKARHLRELETSLATLLSKDEVLAQANHLGAGVGVELLCARGAVLLAFQHVRLHEPPDGGGSSYRRGEALDPELLAAASALVRAMEHTGLAMVEFKRERAGGPWVLIEVNARAWGSLPLAVASGVDFPRALVELLLHGRVPQSRPYRVGLCARNAWMDLGWLVRNRTLDPRDPTLHRRGARELVGEAGALLRGHERWDALALDDPAPGLAELRRLAREGLRLLRGRARRALGGGVLRRLRARRLQRELLRARTLLFVCKGNVCRSPFAAARARELLPRHLCLSSGTYPRTGRACPAEAVALARTHGIELAAHRSRRVDEAELARADLVFVFDDENRRELLALVPGAAPKLRAFAELAPSGPGTIRDPYGGGWSDFERAYAEIERVLAHAGERLRAARSASEAALAAPAAHASGAGSGAGGALAPLAPAPLEARDG